MFAFSTIGFNGGPICIGNTFIVHTAACCHIHVLWSSSRNSCLIAGLKIEYNTPPGVSKPV